MLWYNYEGMYKVKIHISFSISVAFSNLEWAQSWDPQEVENPRKLWTFYMCKLCLMSNDIYKVLSYFLYVGGRGTIYVEREQFMIHTSQI